MPAPFMQTESVRGASRSSASIPIAFVDHETDVLHIEIRHPAGPTECRLDDEEVFVFLEVGSDRAVKFAIPHYSTYWAPRIDRLIAHLDSYDVGATFNAAAALYLPNRSTKVVYL